MQSTEWRPIPGYEGIYEVSNKGDVRRLAHINQKGMSLRERALSPGKVTSGHLQIALSDHQGKRTRHMVHALVLAAFVGPRPQGLHGCHNDGNPLNNHLDNIRWDTPSSNMFDKVAHGGHHHANQTRCQNGHPLEEPNLTQRHKASGRRGCWSCDREWTESARAGREFDTVRADAWFAKLESGWRPVPMGERTHCPQGHELAGSNLKASGLAKGMRTCRTCSIERSRARRAGRPYSTASAAAIYNELTKK